MEGRKPDEIIKSRKREEVVEELYSNKLILKSPVINTFFLFDLKHSIKSVRESIKTWLSKSGGLYIFRMVKLKDELIIISIVEYSHEFARLRLELGLTEKSRAELT